MKREKRDGEMAQEEEFVSEEEEQMGVPLSEGGVEGRREMPLRHNKGVLSYTGGVIGRYLRCKKAKFCDVFAS